MEKIKKTQELLNKGFGVREISRKLNINISIISRIKNNKY